MQTRVKASTCDKQSKRRDRKIAALAAHINVAHNMRRHESLRFATSSRCGRLGLIHTKLCNTTTRRSTRLWCLHNCVVSSNIHGLVRCLSLAWGGAPSPNCWDSGLSWELAFNTRHSPNRLWVGGSNSSRGAAITRNHTGQRTQQAETANEDTYKCRHESKRQRATSKANDETAK